MLLAVRFVQIAQVVALKIGRNDLMNSKQSEVKMSGPFAYHFVCTAHRGKFIVCIDVFNCHIARPNLCCLVSCL